MNLAAWVEKWGRAAPDRPAIALGGATFSTWRQWAARSRALAGSLRALCQPEDRVAIAMTNRPEFLEALFAIWHAGLVAVPMNAKLHSEEFGYIIGDTDASLVLASPDRAGDVARHGRTIVTGSAEWRRLCEGDGIDVVPRAARRSRLAVLHQRHHRPPERRDADARHHDGADARLFRRDRTGRRAGLRAACRADVARLGLLRAAVRRHGREAPSFPKAAGSIRPRSQRCCRRTAMSASLPRRPW